MRYIGSKNRILEFIDEIITETYGDYSNAIIADLFSGTGCVGEMFKIKGAKVISNDYMHFSYAMQIARIKRNKLPRNYHLTIEELNALNGQEGFFFREYTESGPGKRNYFSEDNAKRIDAICLYLKEKLENGDISQDEFFFYKASLIDAVTKVSNTSGTYGSFLKINDNRKYKSIMLESLTVTNNDKENECYCEDITEVIKHVRGDILYLDPPYNNRQYPPYYHILETVTLYDEPNIYGKTGRRHYEDMLSPLCMKEKAVSTMVNIIKDAAFRHCYISYSTDGIMPYKELCEKLESYGEVKVFFKDYRRYKANSNGNIEEDKEKQKEIIIYVKKR